MLPDPLINYTNLKLLMVKYVITVTTEKLYQFEVLHGVNMNILRCPLLRSVA